MSRIGKLDIKIPSGVTIQFEKGIIQVKGPKGELSQDVVSPAINITVEGDTAKVSRTKNDKQTAAFHGLYRALLNNMVTGVSKGFSKTLIITGTGYRAQMQGNELVLQLGYSHPINFPVPNGITIVVDDSRTKIEISGHNKVQVGQVAANIRFFRPPEPYLGKGIRYVNETIRRKVGKASK